jgi:hypothetical protein
MNKYVQPRPYADPEVAARKIVEIANAVEAAQAGRVHIEKNNGPMLFQLKATPDEYKPASIARLKRAGWCCMRAARSPDSPRLARAYSREVPHRHCVLSETLTIS